MVDFLRRPIDISLSEYISSHLEIKHTSSLRIQEEVESCAAASCTVEEARGKDVSKRSDSERNGANTPLCWPTGTHDPTGQQRTPIQKRPMPKSWLRHTSGEVKALRTESLKYPVKSLNKGHLEASRTSLVWVTLVLHSSACALNPKTWPCESVDDASSALDDPEAHHAQDADDEQSVSVDIALSEALWTIEDSLNCSSDGVIKSFHCILLWLNSALEIISERSVAQYSAGRIDAGPTRRYKGLIELASLISRDDCFLTLEDVREIMSPAVSLRNFLYLSGSVKLRDQHLKRVRLLLLLIRSPLVIRASARLLAACEGPAHAPDGRVLGDRSPCGFAAAPASQDSSASTERQQTLLRETALVICAQLDELKDVMLSFSEALALDVRTKKARSSEMINRVKSTMYSFDDVVVAAFAEAITPANMHWRVNPCLKPLDETFAEAGIWPFWLSEGRAVDADTCVIARKVALELLISVKAILLSFALNIEASPKCNIRYGVIAAATDEGVLRLAQDVLKDIDTAFLIPVPNKQEWDSSSNLPVFLWSRCVTRICSRILTAKDVPKAFQDNPRIDTSRMLLDYKSASTTERLQSVSSSQEGQTRCPLTGRLQLPHGLPDEQLRWWRSNNSSEPPNGHLVYISDEGSFRTAAQVARILIGLLRYVPMAGEERSSALVVPPLLRLFDVPQPEVRFLSCHCLEIFVSTSAKHALKVYSIPILQALEQAFPLYDEMDTCYSKYLHAFAGALLTLYSDGTCHTFLNSLEFLYDMSYCGFTAKDEYRLTFLKEVTPLLEHAGTAANLTLYNWLELALHAIQGHTPEGVIQGLNSLAVVLDLALEVDDYLPEIVSRLAVVEAGLHGVSRRCPDANNSSTSQAVRGALNTVLAKLISLVGGGMLTSVIGDIEECFNSLNADQEGLLVQDMLYGVRHIRSIILQHYPDTATS